MGSAKSKDLRFKCSAVRGVTVVASDGSVALGAFFLSFSQRSLGREEEVDLEGPDEAGKKVLSLAKTNRGLTPLALGAFSLAATAGTDGSASSLVFFFVNFSRRSPVREEEEEDDLSLSEPLPA